MNHIYIVSGDEYNLKIIEYIPTFIKLKDNTFLELDKVLHNDITLSDKHYLDNSYIYIALHYDSIMPIWCRYEYTKIKRLLTLSELELIV
jgi:hypothetical protein